MIPPDQLHPLAVRDLMEYLRVELYRAEGERRELEERWRTYLRLYKTEPEMRIKEFPFYGASNLVVPVVATDVDVIYSRIMGLLFGADHLWATRPLHADAVEFAARLQEFLQWAQKHELRAYEAVGDMVLEMCKLGTGILKQRYRREMRRTYQFRETPMGVMEQVEDLQLFDHPEMSHVSCFDFILPSGTIELRDAPWVGERIGLTWGQYQARVRAGIYQDAPAVHQWVGRERGSSGLQEIQALNKQSPSLPDRLDLREVWLPFDVSREGEPQAIVCTLHLPTMSYLRIDYNPYNNQEAPYSAARFMRQEKMFWGIGLAEMLENAQEESTAIHNQRIDNKTLANTQMWKARSDAGIRQDEPVFPGRWFILDDLDAVAPMPMGSLFDSTAEEEQLTLSIASKRTGVNDYISGSFSPAMGYSTASVGMQQWREAIQRFDQTLREIRHALGESGLRIVELYQQFNQGGKPYIVLGAQDGEVLQQFLDFPIELARVSVGVEVAATSATLNKEMEVRTNTLVMEMLTRFYHETLQAMQIALNPQLPPQMRMAAAQMVEGASIMMRRILDAQGVQDVDRLVPHAVHQLLEGYPDARQLQGNGAGMLGAGGAAGPAGLPGGPAMGAGPQGNGGAALVGAGQNGVGF